MKIAVLGTGMVGSSIATKLVHLGHDVCMGSRTADNPKAVTWAKEVGGNGNHGTFADATEQAEMIFNCTAGMASLEALNMAGAANLKGKVIVDVANALDFSKGMPPTLGICNDDSLAERIQKSFPLSHVVKTLNTMNCKLMVDPSMVPGEHVVFVSGNDSLAKEMVKSILKAFGWNNILDLGDITTARGTEMLLPLWLRLWGTLQNPNFNFNIVKG